MTRKGGLWPVLFLFVRRNTVKNQKNDDIEPKPGETITDETLDELTGGKGDDNE